MRNTPTSLGRRLSASRALLPAESVWAPVPEEGLCPRPGAQRLAAQAGPFPTVATRAQPRAHSSRTGWLQGAAGCPARELPRGVGPSQAQSPHCCPALPSPAGHTGGCSAKPRRAACMRFCRGWEAEAGWWWGTPRLFTASTVLATSGCSAHSVYKAAGSMPGKWRGISDCCQQRHHYYYPQQPWVNQGPGGEVTSPGPRGLGCSQSWDGNSGTEWQMPSSLCWLRCTSGCMCRI